MPCRQPSFRKVIPDAFREIQKPQHICDVASALSDRRGDSLLRSAEPFNQRLVSCRFFQRIEVAALDVFDDADFQHFEIVELSNDDRNGM